MTKNGIILILILTAVSFAKVNVGFYSFTQSSGDLQNKWIGYAMADILSEKLGNLNQIQVVKDDQIYDYLVSQGQNPFVNTASINSFNTEIMQNFNLDYLITGNFRVNPDNSLPVNVVVYNLKEGIENPPIVIQGFVNDLYTIISYVTHPACNSMGLNLTYEEISSIKQIDLTTKRTGMGNIYKGKISLRSKDYKAAADFFEEAFKEDPSNEASKNSYDFALSHFYGDGIFAFNLLDTDLSAASPFRKQYMITRRISKSYTGQVVGSKLSPRNMGSHFDIQLDLRLTLDPAAYNMTVDLIKKFSAGGQNKLDEGVYNPNATKVLDEREIFESNVANFQIVIKFTDRDGKVIQQGSQSFKTSFNMTYPGAVKSVFKNDFADVAFSLPSISREIVKNASKVIVTVE
jgi:DNA-binding transcriptional regulator of glucitol operon